MRYICCVINWFISNIFIGSNQSVFKLTIAITIESISYIITTSKLICHISKLDLRRRSIVIRVRKSDFLAWSEDPKNDEIPKGNAPADRPGVCAYAAPAAAAIKLATSTNWLVARQQ